MTEWRDITQEQPPGRGTDPVGIVAIVLGCIGIVTLGMLLALVTAVLGGVAGQRAKATARSLDNAYFALGLAAVDGLVWIVLHLLLDLKFYAG